MIRYNDRRMIGLASMVFLGLCVMGVWHQFDKLDLAAQGVTVLYNRRSVFVAWMFGAWGILFLVLASVPTFWESDSNGKPAPTLAAFAYGLVAILAGFIVGYLGQAWFLTAMEDYLT